jgi:MATE family multidrug resistance protein
VYLPKQPLCELISLNFVVLFAATAALQVSLWYGGEIATWFFGQGPDVSALVSRYSRWMIPGLWPMVSGVSSSLQGMKCAHVLYCQATVAYMAGTCTG